MRDNLWICFNCHWDIFVRTSTKLSRVLFHYPSSDTRGLLIYEVYEIKHLRLTKVVTGNQREKDHTAWPVTDSHVPPLNIQVREDSNWCDFIQGWATRGTGCNRLRMKVGLLKHVFYRNETQIWFCEEIKWGSLYQDGRKHGFFDIRLPYFFFVKLFISTNEFKHILFRKHNKLNDYNNFICEMKREMVQILF